MKVFDCFMFYDEKVLLDIRLNVLNEFVDYFVIVESCFTHRGDLRDLNFDIEKFRGNSSSPPRSPSTLK